jgi:cold shock CspA family protein
MYGRIERIVHKHGFGFIRAYDGQEVFFHRKSLVKLDFHSLREGQTVDFEEERAAGDSVRRAAIVRPRQE